MMMMMMMLQVQRHNLRVVFDLNAKLRCENASGSMGGEGQ